MRLVTAVSFISKSTEAYLQEECPLGKLVNPSLSFEAFGCLHAVEEIRRFQSGNCVPSPPRAYCSTVAGSRSHRDRRSGLGFPTRFFKPSVKKNVVASPKTRPSQAAFHSHSLYFHNRALGISLDRVGPGVTVRATIAVMIAGARNEITTRTPVDIFSCSTWGMKCSDRRGRKDGGCL